MNKVLNMTYASSLTNLCEINSSFDMGVLRVCYTGENRNGSFISKESLEQGLKTIYNCPVVCNYDRESDTFGGHDIEIIRTDAGGLKIVNVTQPVGVIPESARVWFDECEDEYGVMHEYLFVDVLLWKRQEAYQKIKDDGITAHSMEITVKKGSSIDGVYHIEDFEFTAFALIGVEPCYESSALEVFSKTDFKNQLSEMMRELKETYTMATSPNTKKGNDNKNDYSMEGGKIVLEDKMNLAAKYGIDVDTLGFSMEDFTIEELTEKFEAMKESNTDTNKFALTSNVTDELSRLLSNETVTREWGECHRYWYVDCDLESAEVYCWDTEDWLLYGLAYTIDGDSITIDYSTKKRKKYEIVDFDNGEQASPFAEVFSVMERKYHEMASTASEYEQKFNIASESMEDMNGELAILRKFKSDADDAAAEAERKALFANFTDLDGIEAFEELKTDCAKYDINTIEEKCFAIRGRNNSVAKFSHDSKPTKLKVEKTESMSEPYGGLFVKYGTAGSQ